MSQLVTIVGNLANDPELRFTANGKAQARFPVATSERYKNDKGEWESRNLTYWNCVAWDAMAENVTDSLKKGDKVIVYGKAFTVSWEDKKTGEKRSKMEVQVVEVGAGLSKATARIEKQIRPKADNTPPWERATPVDVGVGGGWGSVEEVPPF